MVVGSFAVPPAAGTKKQFLRRLRFVGAPGVELDINLLIYKVIFSVM
jgi:hypothetical protein